MQLNSHVIAREIATFVADQSFVCSIELGEEWIRGHVSALKERKTVRTTDRGRRGLGENRR